MLLKKREKYLNSKKETYVFNVTLSGGSYDDKLYDNDVNKTIERMVEYLCDMGVYACHTCTYTSYNGRHIKLEYKATWELASVIGPILKEIVKRNFSDLNEERIVC